MTPDERQATREALARKWLDWYKSSLRVRGIGSYVSSLEVDALVALIASREAATLEEAKAVVRTRIGRWKSHGGAEIAFPYGHLTVEGELEVILQELERRA